MASSLTKVKLELLTDIDILLLVVKGIRGGICQTIYQYAKANHKYMKDYDNNKEPSYLKYWNVNNLHGFAMSQKLPVNNFEWIEDTSKFNKENNERYFLEVDVQYSKILPELHNDLSFFPERMNIEKVEKLVTNLHDKNGYVIHIRNLKQALIYGLVLKKFIELLNLIKKLG